MCFNFLVDKAVVIKTIFIVTVSLAFFPMRPGESNVASPPLFLKLEVTPINPVLGIDHRGCFGMDHNSFFLFINYMFTAFAIIGLESIPKLFVCLDEALGHR